jgi:4'-phosphopantetheinyl transferase EntD
VSQAMLSHKKQTDVYDLVLSQTFPHAEVTYKYFWPKDKLDVHFEQAKVRKAEAAKISKVLDGIVFDEFNGIDQSYLALSL